MLSYRTIIQTVLTDAIFFMGIVALLFFFEEGNVDMAKLFPPAIMRITSVVVFAMPAWIIARTLRKPEWSDKGTYLRAMIGTFIVYVIVIGIFAGSIPMEVFEPIVSGGKFVQLLKVLGVFGGPLVIATVIGAQGIRY